MVHLVGFYYKNDQDSE